MMGLSVICFEGSHKDFPNKCVFQSLNIAFVIANNANPDEMQQTTKLPFQGFPVYKGYIAHCQMSSIKKCPLAQKHKKNLLV